MNTWRGRRKGREGGLWTNSIVRKQTEIAFVTLAQQTLLPSTMAISLSFNHHTQEHSPLDVSKSRLRISSNVKNYVLVVPTNDEAASGVF